jgi:hypothetical protein
MPFSNFDSQESLFLNEEYHGHFLPRFRENANSKYNQTIHRYLPTYNPLEYNKTSPFKQICRQLELTSLFFI